MFKIYNCSTYQSESRLMLFHLSSLFLVDPFQPAQLLNDDIKVQASHKKLNSCLQHTFYQPNPFSDRTMSSINEPQNYFFIAVIIGENLRKTREVK